MKFKKEYIVLLIIILALVLYLVYRKQDRIQYQLPVLTKINTDKLTMIEIIKPDVSVILKKKGGDWLIGEEEYQSDISIIKNILDSIESPLITAMISDSKTFERYGLDEKNKIVVKAFSGDNLERIFELGNSTSSGRQTFIKLAQDYRVYHTGKNLRAQFDKEMDEFRDKTVLSFSVDEIREILIRKGDKSIDLKLVQVSPENNDKDVTDSKNTKALWQTAEGVEPDQSFPDELFSTLPGLKCEEYIYNIKKDGLTDPICTITLKGLKNHTLSIFPKINDDDTQYPAVSSLSNDPFMLMGWRAEKIINTCDKLFTETDKI